MHAGPGLSITRLTVLGHSLSGCHGLVVRAGILLSISQVDVGSKDTDCPIACLITTVQ